MDNYWPSLERQVEGEEGNDPYISCANMNRRNRCNEEYHKEMNRKKESIEDLIQLHDEKKNSVNNVKTKKI